MVSLKLKLSQHRRSKRDNLPVYKISLGILLLIIATNLWQYNTLGITTGWNWDDSDVLHHPNVEYMNTTLSATTLLRQHTPQSLHQLPQSSVTWPNILVVYSGPATLTQEDSNKIQFYLRNLEFFLHHGVDCTRHETVIVLGHDVALQYRELIRQLDQNCHNHHRVTLIERDNVCYDLESVRLVLHGNVTNLPVLDYDYFFHVNCGTTGPVMPLNETHVPWTNKFIEKLVGNVKMVGISHVCEGDVSHIQSMVYAVDKVGLQLIQKSCVPDCRAFTDELKNMSKMFSVTGLIIDRYERCMSITILNQGYEVASLYRSKTLTKENRDTCTDKDLWLTSKLNETFGKIPSLGEVIFFKTSRVLTEETARMINYTGTISWNW